MPITTLKQFLLILLTVGFLGAVATIGGCGGGGSDSGAHNPNPDADGDGINNNNDGDIDGDGIPNGQDPDIDQDGKPNDSDNDDDGDGILDEDDKTPGGPVGPPPGGGNTGSGDTGTACTTTKITWPNDEVIAGNSADLRWELQPKGCALSSAQNKSVKATAKSGNVSIASVAKSAGQLITTIRVPCDPQFGTNSRPVAYDFTELGQAIDDGLGGYKHTINHPGPAKGCSGEDGNSGGGSGGTQCSDFSGTNGGTYPNCTCQNKDYTFDGGACVAPDPPDGGGEPTNECPTENGTGGTYPSCSCRDGYNYNPPTNTCDEPGSCTSAVVNWPSEIYPRAGTKKMTITWTLKPKGCTVYVPSSHDGIVRGSADLVGVTGYFKFSNGQYASKGEALWTIPCFSSGIHPSGEPMDYELEYLELAELLGDTNTAPYVKKYFQDPTCRL